METACLRIKFTPLFQQKHQDASKCFLEIVPEVSCIQNFDKIEWKEENNLIEYIIPMTYKIILKKRQNIIESDGMVKTYHSCVDLPLPSSVANLSLASGDVPRITSDTLILTKFTTQISTDEIDSKEEVVNLAQDRKTSIATDSYTILDKMTNTSLHITDVTRESSKQNFENTEVVESLELQDDPDSVDKALSDKITGTDSICLFAHPTEQNPQALRTCKADFKCRLSLTPICSISTQGSANETKIASSRAIICKIYESQKDLMPLGSASSPSPSDLYNDNQTSNGYSKTTKDGSTNSLDFKGSYRIMPEIRIAGYKQMIEEEILPLKIILNEIIHKCTLLGITRVKNFTPNSSDKSVSICEAIETIEEQTKSNRVVYSIIFDEERRCDFHK